MCELRNWSGLAGRVGVLTCGLAWIFAGGACSSATALEKVRISSSAGAVRGGKVIVEKVEYKGWRNNLRITNGQIELIVTLDVGPRIIRCGFVGGPNIFKEYEDQLGKSGEKEWKIRGGHRLWHCLLYTSPSPRDLSTSRMPSSA